ncbi:actin filament-associated protein 1-like 2 isoform X1 [Alosa sapidissima]|uniref:actin filament-associated protein 1-like 2 isoform X1 n=1 Tax=Alosa sapidissima TaxID=34773 RepID=UPI001C082D40|nr:actin filament-associated protein 1-like 2 isoform X1 [Alosa sapidissima]
MDKQKVLARLLSDLQTFLSVLDSENLSYIAQAQKKSISELLARLQDKEPAVEDAEYMIMNCPSGAPNSDLRENQCSAGAEVDSSEELPSSSSTEWLRSVSVGPPVPPLPPEGPVEEDCYEEAEPFVPANHITDKGDSDSSHYESYGEEDDGELVKDRAHYIQWSASQPCLRPLPESRICGYLWRRKKWLGQWTRQLFIIKHNLLLCYKCAKDLNPLLELNLLGCQVVYKSRHSKKMQHELKVVAGSDTVIMGFQSCQQAEEWRKIIEEVSGSSYCEPESHGSSSMLKSDRLDSCRSSTVLHTDSDDERLSALPSAPSPEESKDRAGFLNVLMNCQWQSLWCRVEGGVLKMFREEEEASGGDCSGDGDGSPQYSVQLRGAQVQPGPDTASSYRISLLQHGDQVAVLEASCSDEKEQWVQLLQDGSVPQGQSTVDPYHHRASHESLPLSGLKTRRFPTSNMYMDDPFQQLGSVHSQPIYSNTCILEHMFQNSHGGGKGDCGSSRNSVNYGNNEVFSNHSQGLGEMERGVQKLDLTGKRRVQLRAGSEVNLINAGKPAKRTSFRQSLAFCTERVQGGFFSPLLRRTASAKHSLKHAPSSLFIEHGKVFQKRKEWETKAST